MRTESSCQSNAARQSTAARQSNGRSSVDRGGLGDASRMQKDCRDSRQPFASPRKPEGIGSRRRNAHRRAEDITQSGLCFRASGRELRRVADELNGDVPDFEAHFSNQAEGFAKKNVSVRVGEPGVTGSENTTHVAQVRRREHRVADGVTDDIAVTVSVQTRLLWPK